MEDEISKELDDVVTKHIVQRQKAINKGKTMRDNVRYVKKVRPLVHPRNAESFEADVEEHSCSECGEEGPEGICGCYLDNLHGSLMVSIRANNCPFCKTKGFELGTPCYSCGANFRKTKDSEGNMRWKEDTQTMLEMADYGAESFGADKGLGFIINPASIGKGLPTYWAFDVDNDQVNYQTCLTCTQPIDYEIDEDDEFSGVQCKSCESKYEYREYEVGDKVGYYLKNDAESFEAEGGYNWGMGVRQRREIFRKIKASGEEEINLANKYGGSKEDGKIMKRIATAFSKGQEDKCLGLIQELDTDNIRLLMEIVPEIFVSTDDALVSANIQLVAESFDAEDSLKEKLKDFKKGVESDFKPSDSEYKPYMSVLNKYINMDGSEKEIIEKFVKDWDEIEDDDLWHKYYVIQEGVISEFDAESFEAQKYGKRQAFDMPYGRRYVARNSDGEFISNVDAGRSLSADRRQKAKTSVDAGFGQMGDIREAEDSLKEKLKDFKKGVESDFKPSDSEYKPYMSVLNKYINMDGSEKEIIEKFVKDWDEIEDDDLWHKYYVIQEGVISEFEAESFEAPTVYRGARPSPSTSATSVNVGTKMRGGNGKMWVCKSYPRGNKRVKRWVLAAEDGDWEIDDRDLWNPEREAIDQIRSNRALREQMEEQGIHIGRHPGYYDDSGRWVEKEGYHDYGGIKPVPLWVQIGIVLGAITGVSVAAKKGWLNFGYDEPLPDQNETEDNGEA